MPVKSFRTATAIIAALSLMPPLPALAQSTPGADARENGVPTAKGKRIDKDKILSFEKLCAEAMLSDARACELHIQELLAAAEAEALVAADAAAQTAAEADAAAQVAADAKGDAKAAAKAMAAELARAAAEAAAQAREAAEITDRLAETEAAAQAAAEAGAAEEVADDAEAAAQAADEAGAADDVEEAAQAVDEADTAAAEQDDDAATETSARPIVADCPAEVIGSDGTIHCVDALTSESVAAIAAETDAQVETEAEVITETVTEDDIRTSDEVFSKWPGDGDQDGDEPGDQAAKQDEGGLSDLERTGLFALGAVVVGAILSGGQRVVANTGDRVIVANDDGSYRVLKDDDALLRQPGSEVRTERFSDGSTRTILTRDDGTRIITIRDSTGRALRRLRIDPDGTEYLLIDDTRTFDPVVVRDLPRPVYDEFGYRAASDRESLRQALLAADRRDIGRSFSLRQVREYVEVRENMSRCANWRPRSTSRRSPSPRTPPRSSRRRRKGCARWVC